MQPCQLVGRHDLPQESSTSSVPDRSASAGGEKTVAGRWGPAARTQPRLNRQPRRGHAVLERAPVGGASRRASALRRRALPGRPRRGMTGKGRPRRAARPHLDRWPIVIDRCLAFPMLPTGFLLHRGTMLSTGKMATRSGDRTFGPPQLGQRPIQTLPAQLGLEIRTGRVPS